MVVVGGGSGGRSWSLAAVGIGGVAGYTWWKGWWRFDQVMPVNKAQFNEGIGQLRTKLQVRLLIHSHSAMYELVARSSHGEFDVELKYTTLRPDTFTHTELHTELHLTSPFRVHLSSFTCLFRLSVSSFVFLRLPLERDGVGTADEAGVDGTHRPCTGADRRVHSTGEE